MGPELGPPAVEQLAYPDEDRLLGRASGSTSPRQSTQTMTSLLNGDLGDARYAWEQIEAAYASGPYAHMREAVAC